MNKFYGALAGLTVGLVAESGCHRKVSETRDTAQVIRTDARSILTQPQAEEDCDVALSFSSTGVNADRQTLTFYAYGGEVSTRASLWVAAVERSRRQAHTWSQQAFDRSESELLLELLPTTYSDAGNPNDSIFKPDFIVGEVHPLVVEHTLSADAGIPTENEISDPDRLVINEQYQFIFPILSLQPTYFRVREGQIRHCELPSQGATDQIRERINANISAFVPVFHSVDQIRHLITLLQHTRERGMIEAKKRLLRGMINKLRRWEREMGEDFQPTNQQQRDPREGIVNPGPQDQVV